MVKKILLVLLKFYKTAVSPFLGCRCRFSPTCSEYCMDAINDFGVCKGALIALWRIIRCNPFCEGGFDPIKKG